MCSENDLVVDSVSKQKRTKGGKHVAVDDVATGGGREAGIYTQRLMADRDSLMW